jgi:hypothetical protein
VPAEGAKGAIVRSRGVVQSPTRATSEEWSVITVVDGYSEALRLWNWTGSAPQDRNPMLVSVSKSRLIWPGNDGTLSINHAK